MRYEKSPRSTAFVPLSIRFTAREITLSRANRSVRLFDRVVCCLASGRQPEASDLDSVGYLMRTTAVYGNGKFGLADRDAIVEIRAGTGGSEAAIFAADLYRMYNRYAESAGLKAEDLESSPSELGGLKEVIFRVSGESVFRKLRYESGVHRVQRVPATEAQGRIHTSTATVAVLPEAEEVDIDLKPEELRIEVSRAGGPGGQGVNTTDSAVQVMHIPTGTIVRCQDGRSQIKNKERALSILRARLLERKQREEAQKYSAQRRGQIGTGGREEKIRTYNFPQNRVTDHRIGLTLYKLDRVVDGDLGEMIQALQAADVAERLKESSLPA